MNEQINNKICTIFKEIPNNSATLQIVIECEDEFDIKVSSKWIFEDKEIYISLNGVKDFYFYIQKYRNLHPEHQFKQICITAINSRITKVEFS